MAQYRKRPVVVEAMQFTHGTKNQVFNFVTSIPSMGFDEHGDPVLKIHTLEGDMTATIGDWVIRGVAGEFYPCKDEIFRATYEPVDADAA